MPLKCSSWVLYQWCITVCCSYEIMPDFCNCRKIRYSEGLGFNLWNDEHCTRQEIGTIDNILWRRKVNVVVFRNTSAALVEGNNALELLKRNNNNKKSSNDY